MKKGIFIVLVFLTLKVFAQQDTLHTEHITLPDSSARGEPIGNVVSKSIGTEGGSIISEDGRVELVFPAGALTSPKEITIQSITNVLTGGMGKAYRFEPSGIQFAKPVLSILHYTSEEEEICAPDLMAFGLQDHSGKWSYGQYENWDSVKKTVSGNIKHFSDQVPYSRIRLLPGSYELRVDDILTLRAVLIEPKVSMERGFLEPRIDVTSIPVWTVNGLENGGLTPLGVDYGSTIPIGRQYRVINADYIAPHVLPDKGDIIIVQVSILVATSKESKVEKSFTCKITLYDEYKVLITDTIETRAGEGTFVDDSATFVARVYMKRIDITDVRNYPPHTFRTHKPPLHATLTVLLAGYKGPVHIGRTESNGEGFSYSQSFFIEENKPRKVLIKFDTYNIAAYKYIYSLAALFKDMQEMNMESVPDLVNFYLNGESQKISIDSHGGTSYTIYVKRYGLPKKHYPTTL